MELYKLLLNLTTYLLEENFEQAQEIARQIGELQITDTDDILTLRETLRDFFVSDDRVGTYEQAKTLIENLKLDDTDTLLAYIEISEIGGEGKISFEKFKTTTAYQTLENDPKFFNVSEKKLILSGISVFAIRSRDQQFINYMLGKLE